MRVLITGAYGFIGYSTAVRLLNDGHEVVGVDRLTGALSEKGPRIAELSQRKGFEFSEANLSDFAACERMFSREKFDAVLHLAGQYSVMHSTRNMLSYVDGNCKAFVNVIECAKNAGLKRFVYASSTFVQDGQMPVSMYGATKIFNEHVANVYSECYGMQTVGVRYASTYGPHMRPDTGPYILARKLHAGEPIKVDEGGFNFKSGWCFIDDAVECTLRLLTMPMQRLHNIATVVADDVRHDLGEILDALERHSGIRAKRVGQLPELAPAGAPDRQLNALGELIGYRPPTKLEDGMQRFAQWFTRALQDGYVRC